MLPIITILDAIGTDGDFAVFTVELSQPSLGDVTVQYRSIQDGTAVENGTYTRAFNTLTIPAGETTGTISVDLGFNNSTDFDDTNFTLQLSDPVNAVLAGGGPTLTATGVELDNSGTTNDRALFVSDPVVIEGTNGITQAVFEVRISETSVSTLNFSYTTADGTAIAGEDYTAKSGTVSFAPGQTVRTVVVDITEDSKGETAENFSLIVTPNSSIANGVFDAGGVATILDDDTSTEIPVISLLPAIGSDGDLSIFDVILSQPSLADVTVQFRTIQDGTGVEDGTFNDAAGTLTIPAGETVATISVDLGFDSNTDNDDTNFSLQLSDPVNAVLSGGQPTLTATGLEIDNSGSTNDRGLFVSDPVVIEGNDGVTKAVFEVRISEPASLTLNFEYTTADGTALAGQDYTATSGILTFAPGQTVASVFVDISEDSLGETAETFSLIVAPNLAIANGVLDAGGVATILDDDTSSEQPVISLMATTGKDGDKAIFDLILSQASLADITVQYRTIQDGTGTDNESYARAFNTLTIPAGETVSTISVDLGFDANTDNDDTNVTLQLSDPVNAVLSGGQPTLTAIGIEKDNSGSTNDRALFVSDPVFLEGDSGTTKAVFEVHISEPSAATLNFDFTTVNGSAIAGQDYTAASGTITFLPGQTVASVAVDITEDTNREASEFFSLIVSPNAAIANGILDAGGIATILDDDTLSDLPVISFLPTQGSDGEFAIFDVILSKPSVNVVTMQFRTVQDGTGVSGSTYTNSEGTLTIPAGETVGTIAVNLGFDSSTDNDDTNFTMQLSEPTNAVFAGGQPNLTATGVELDNSGSTNDRGLFVSDPQFLEGSEGVVKAVFEVRISEPSTTTLEFEYTSIDGTAVSGQDYFGKSGIVTFLPGQTVASVSFNIIEDNLIESSETFSLVVTPNAAIANGVLDASGTATILNDDAADMVITGNSGANVLTGDSGNDTIYGLGGNDIIYGLAGNDRLFGGKGIDQVFGGSGNDYVKAGGGAEDFDGGSGKDYISYYDSTGGITVNLAQNTISGSWAVNDTIKDFESFAGSNKGGDTVTGTSGANTIRTYGGNDRVFGGKGNDKIELGSGNDYVKAGGGAESFDGGSGKDWISYYDSTGGITVNLAQNTISGSWAVNDTIKDFESFSGSKNGDDNVTGTSGSNTIRTYGGDDRVSTLSGTDVVELGAGNDYVRAGGGKESFDGGSGTDYISYWNSSNGIRIDLRDDEVSGSWAVNDTIKDFESASGSKTGDDVMLGTNGANTLRGNGGDDKLYGRGGSDKLYGGDGEDFFDGGGGAGTDLLYGGADADVFHFDRGEGVDIIKDFENNIDLIELDGFALTKTEVLDLAMQVGNDVVFDFGSDGMLTVENATIGQLGNDLDIV